MKSKIEESSTSDERRAFPRADFVLKVEYPTREGFLRDYTINISRGGMMIRVSRELNIGDSVELHLSFPGLLAPFPCKGIVRWVERDGPNELTAGVEFDPLTSVGQDELSKLVSRIKTGDQSIVAPLLHILIVEDNPHVAKLIADGLAACQKRSAIPVAFTTHCAVNGEEALAQIAKKPCDILLVDMYLPVMDGESLIRTIREDPNWRHLPIVALSAGGKDAMEQALAAGADFFLDKPIRLADLLTTLRRLITTLENPSPSPPPPP